MATTTSRKKQSAKKGKDQKKSKRLDKKQKAKGGLTAATSDRHELYEMAVQEPEAEIDLIEQMWSEQHTRECRSIREDFAGTAQVCMEWVKRHPEATAIAVDLDDEVLGWGERKAAERLSPEELERVQFLREDVLKTTAGPVDSVLAMNFSYYLFLDRATMRAYFENVRRALNPDGLFLLDAYGGSEAFEELEEPRKLKGFTYIWEQHSYDPITGYAQNFIHFEFPDGTRMDRAFEYPWRLWTLPEIRELLAEAGFSDVKIYWEGTDDETGEGNGEFEETEVGEACPGWVAYLVARP